MSMEAITLKVDSDAARAFKSVSVADKEKFQIMLGIWLKEYARASTGSLRETMDEISRKARDRGLTPDVLDSLLKEE